MHLDILFSVAWTWSIFLHRKAWVKRRLDEPFHGTLFHCSFVISLFKDIPVQISFNYRVIAYASHIPSIPPTTLPSNEVIENESAPTREGKYPPAKEPIIIPNIIIVFRDMVVSKIGVHFHALLRSSKSSQVYCSRCRIPGRERDNRANMIID